MNGTLLLFSRKQEGSFLSRYRAEGPFHGKSCLSPAPGNKLWDGRFNVSIEQKSEELDESD